jgi:hypothetical protein
MLPAHRSAVQQPTQYSTGQAIGMIAFSTVVLFGYIVYDHYTEQSKAKSREEVPRQEVCAKGDLECLGNRALGSASVYCRSQIERQAAHSVKWTDGMLTPKFSQFRWRDPIEGSITYIGDRAEFQNGFGAFGPVVYECDLAADERGVCPEQG